MHTQDPLFTVCVNALICDSELNSIRLDMIIPIYPIRCSETPWRKDYYSGTGRSPWIFFVPLSHIHYARSRHYGAQYTSGGMLFLAPPLYGCETIM